MKPDAPSSPYQQALRASLAQLADQVAAGRDTVPAAAPVPGQAWELVLRSGVSVLNDNAVGRFACRRTAQLCGEFLLALDQVEHPEYVGFSLRQVATGEQATSADAASADEDSDNDDLVPPGHFERLAAWMHSASRRLPVEGVRPAPPPIPPLY